MKKLVYLVALMFLFAACDDKDKPKPAEEPGALAAAKPAKPAVDDGFKDVPNSSGIRADVPANAVPNGIGGAAGFHSKDDSYGFTVMEVAAADQSKTFAQAKKDTEEFMFKKWLKEEKTADGWVLTCEMPKMDMSGDEPKEVGTIYGFEVRTKLGGKLYKCYGSVAKADGLDAVLKTCTTLKAK
ncbi:MAG TPA: hypothetical protein VM425_03595 [Myxococcota bacterium]|nr:hypothetical protein [Myxococcota bacterium]